MTRTTELYKGEVNLMLSTTPLRCKGGEGYKKISLKKFTLKNKLCPELLNYVKVR